MLGGISYSTKKEKEMDNAGVKFAYEHKDKAVAFSKIQALSLGMVLVLSLLTLRDSFTCTGNFAECDAIRSKLSCKAQLVSPISLAFDV